MKEPFVSRLVLTEYGQQFARPENRFEETFTKA